MKNSRDRTSFLRRTSLLQGEYSTVFIGGTSAFEPFGSFAGLAETVDTGNAVRNDNAFVILKGGESIEAIIDTIAHETQHLIGTLDHGGEGLGRYGVGLKRCRSQMSPAAV